MRKRRLLLTIGACLATLSLGAGSVASADPVDPPTGPRPHPGVGSGTTHDVMNGFANGVMFSVPPFGGIVNGAGFKVLGSWDAMGPTPITYRNSPPECVNVNIRPRGGEPGVDALRGIGFPEQCVDWARTAVQSFVWRSGQNLRYIPYALDTVTYATLGNTKVPKSLSVAQLHSIYKLNVGQALCDGNETNGEFKPVLPRPGSDTRVFWLQLIGVTEAQIGTCVNSTQAAAPEEHDCGTIKGDRELVPFGVAQHISQTQRPEITNRAGNCQLRAINGEYSVEINLNHDGARQVYNVLKGEDVGNPAKPDLNAAFVGAGSKVCSHPEVIKAYGFKPIPAGDPSPCGSQFATP